jgi:sugar phosphate isomerase/epimerase
MSLLDRRSFFGTAAASLSMLSAKTLKTFGVQLYTLRNVLPKEPGATLKALEKLGYQEVELVAATMNALWPALKDTSLKPVSVHLDTALFTTAQDKLPAALDDAAKRGLKYAVCPYIAPKDRGGIPVIKKLGEALNKAGETCNKSGLLLCYHNHAFEFEPTPEGTLLDVLMKTTDPKLVSLELDIMWSQVAGVDPVSVLQKYPKRIALIHLKNVATGIEKRYNEGVPASAFKEVGNGVINIPAVLKAADKAKVQHYFVEQDQAPGNPLDSLKQSHDYLATLKF